MSDERSPSSTEHGGAPSRTSRPRPRPPVATLRRRPRPSRGRSPEARAQEYLELAQRKQAEFENFRKRMSAQSAAGRGPRRRQARQGAVRAAWTTSRLAIEHADEATRGPLRVAAGGVPARRSAASASSRSPRSARSSTPTEHEAMAQAPVEGAEPGTVAEVYQAGLPARRDDPAAGPRGGRGLGPWPAPGDFYKTLGVDKKASAGGDQEGVPQARAPVPPGPQPGRRAGRGALQGDLGGLRRPLGPREAQEVRPRRLDVRRRRQPVRRGRRRRRPAPTPGGFSDILSDLFGSATGGRWRRRRAPSRRPRSGRDLETEVSIVLRQAVEGAQVPVAVATHAPCPTCRGTGAEPGTEPIVCPVCQGRGVESQGQGLFSITRPCARCNGVGHGHRAAVPHLPRRGPPARAQALQGQHPRRREGRLAHPPRRQGRGRAARRPARRPVRGHAREPSRRSSSRKGDNLEVEIPITIVEAMRGAEVEVPTLHGHQDAARAGRAPHGTVQRLRGEGPPLLGGLRPRRHPLPLRHRRPRRR